MGVVFEPFGSEYGYQFRGMVSLKLGIENYMIVFCLFCSMRADVSHFLFWLFIIFVVKVGYRISCICCKGFKMVEGVRKWWEGVNLLLTNLCS